MLRRCLTDLFFFLLLFTRPQEARRLWRVSVAYLIILCYLHKLFNHAAKHAMGCEMAHMCNLKVHLMHFKC